MFVEHVFELVAVDVAVVFVVVSDVVGSGCGGSCDVYTYNEKLNVLG